MAIEALFQTDSIANRIYSPQPHPAHAINDDAAIGTGVGDVHEAAVASFEGELADGDEVEGRGLGALIEREFGGAGAVLDGDGRVRGLGFGGAEADADLIAAGAWQCWLEMNAHGTDFALRHDIAMRAWAGEDIGEA